ncbi:DeoR family transcriptional regulator, partial [Streptomyces sp. SID9124]|nr:DeoR family transcriptional regulator [Streptomyces sp. SID9124]
AAESGAGGRPARREMPLPGQRRTQGQPLRALGESAVDRERDRDRARVADLRRR